MKTLKKSFLIAGAALLALSLAGCQKPKERPSSDVATVSANQGSTLEKTITVDLSDNPLTDETLETLEAGDSAKGFFSTQFLDAETLEMSDFSSELEDFTATLKEFSSTSLTIDISVTLPEKDGRLLFLVQLGGSGFKNTKYVNQKGVLIVNIGSVPNVTETAMKTSSVSLADDESLYLYRTSKETEKERSEIWYAFTNTSAKEMRFTYSLEDNKYTASTTRATYTIKDGIMYNSSNKVYGSLVKNGDSYYIINESFPRTDGEGLFASFSKEVDGIKSTFSSYKDGLVEIDTESSDIHMKLTELYTNKNGCLSVFNVGNVIYDGSSIITAEEYTKGTALPEVADSDE